MGLRQLEWFDRQMLFYWWVIVVLVVLLQVAQLTALCLAGVVEGMALRV